MYGTCVRGCCYELSDAIPKKNIVTSREEEGRMNQLCSTLHHLDRTFERECVATGKTDHCSSDASERPTHDTNGPALIGSDTMNADVCCRMQTVITSLRSEELHERCPCPPPEDRYVQATGALAHTGVNPSTTRPRCAHPCHS